MFDHDQAFETPDHLEPENDDAKAKFHNDLADNSTSRCHYSVLGNTVSIDFNWLVLADLRLNCQTYSSASLAARSVQYCRCNRNLFVQYIYTTVPRTRIELSGSKVRANHTIPAVDMQPTLSSDPRWWSLDVSLDTSHIHHVLRLVTAYKQPHQLYEGIPIPI